jgi:ferredoxin-NADP reductase
MNAIATTAASPWHEATIERIGHITPRIVSVLLKSPLARPVAGQHVEVRLTADDGYAALRSYSIASAPSSTLIELIVEKLDDGEVSPYFHEVAQAGDVIEVRGPLGGHFIWTKADGGPLLLVAGGSGIAPLMSMVRHWHEADSTTPLLLVYSARTWAELAFADELQQLQANEPGRFLFVAATTREAPRREGDLGRRLDAAQMQGLLARWGHTPRHAFVCGSNRFVEAATNGLQDAGVPAAVIRTERYGGTE